MFKIFARGGIIGRIKEISTNNAGYKGLGDIELYTKTINRMKRAGIREEDHKAQVVFLAAEIERYREKIIELMDYR